MRRVLLISLILVSLLVIGGVVTAHLILRSDLPRRIVQQIIADETGLRVTIDALDVTWRGETSVRGFSAGLPMEPDSFLTVASIRLQHNHVIHLMLTRRLVLSDAILDEPALTVIPDSHGLWNLLRAADLISAAQGDGDAVSEPDQFPRLRVTDASLSVATADGGMQHYTGLGFTGDPIGPLSWRFHLDFAENVQFEGRIAPAARWQHEATFELQEIHGLLVPWIADVPERLRVAGRWTGTVRGGVLEGRLQLDRLDADRFDGSGTLDVRVDQRQLIVEPRSLVVSADDGSIGPFTVGGGMVTFDGRHAQASRLEVQGFGITAMVGMEYDHQKEAGTARVTWRGRDETLGLAHDGQAEAEISFPSIGERGIRASWSAAAGIAEGRVYGRGAMELIGYDWYAMSGQITSERLRIQRDSGEVDLDGLAADVTVNWPDVRIPRFTIAGAPIQGSAELDALAMTWSAKATAKGWNPGLLLTEVPEGPVDFELRASGTRQAFSVDRFVVSQNGRRAEATAMWNIEAMHDPLSFKATVQVPVLSSPAVPASGKASLTVSGRGAINPVEFTLDGRVAVESLVLAGREFLPMDVAWSGTMTADRLDVQTPQLKVFGGLWSAEAEYERAGNRVRVRARSRDCSLARLIELVQIPVSMSGDIAAEVTIDLPEFDLQRLSVDGAWETASLQGPGMSDARARGQVRVRGDEVALDGMQLEQGEGLITGRAAFNLSAPDRVTLDLRGERWPVAIALLSVTGEVHGEAALLVDLVSLGAEGTLDVGGSVDFDGVSVGTFTTQGSVDGRRVQLADAAFHGLGGSATGSVHLELDEARWQDSHASLHWTEIDLGLLHQYVPDLGALGGLTSGSLVIARSEQPRAVEPMEVTIAADITDGALGPVIIERFDLNGFFGAERAVVDRAVLLVADGEVSSWMRLGRHGDEMSLHVHLDFDRIDLDQVAQLVALSDGAMPGRVAGTISFGGYPFSDPQRIFGSGQASLRQSELVGLPGFREIYDLVSLTSSRDDPRGYGDAQIRIEGTAVEISRLTYFNRGTDVVARLTIHDIWAREASPISGVAVGVIRPLRDVRLPFIGTLDRLLGAVQTDMSTVRISGTLAEQEVTIIPFSQVGTTIRRILAAPSD